jgi:hypothetical protein
MAGANHVRVGIYKLFQDYCGRRLLSDLQLFPPEAGVKLYQMLALNGCCFPRGQAIRRSEINVSTIVLIAPSIISLLCYYLGCLAMNSINSKLLHEIKKDQALAPFFIDYIGEHLKMKMAIHHKVEKDLELKIRQSAYKSLLNLVQQLQNRVSEQETYLLIEHACRYYLQFIVGVEGGLFDLSKKL